LSFFKNFKILVLLCITLGLAPFYPEPHIWGKLKWVYGGAKGMQLIDWIDVLLHGFPFILLIIAIVSKISRNAT